MATTAPVEFRFFMRRFTLQHLESGMQPIRQQIGPVVNGQAPTALFVPPQLQTRYKEKVHVDGAPQVVWTEWVDVPIVREEQATES